MNRSMSDKQADFIESLVVQLGYITVEDKKYFLDRIGFGNANSLYASNLIEGLLKENKRRKFAHRKEHDEHTASTVQEITQFVFCHASYSIKKSFEIESYYENELQEYTIEDYDSKQSSLLELIKALNNLNSEEDKQQYSDYLNDFSDLLDNSIVFNGYSDEYQQYFYNKIYNIKGKPHLIMEDSSENQIIVLEKMSHKYPLPDALWENHKIQALLYLYLFEEIKCSKVEVVYWYNQDSSLFPLRRSYQRFTVNKSDENFSILMNAVELFKELIDSIVLPFDNNINPKKCFKCNCRTICNHKSTILDALYLPYYTEEYYKQFPLYYTKEEREELQSTDRQGDKPSVTKYSNLPLTRPRRKHGEIINFIIIKPNGEKKDINGQITSSDSPDKSI